MFKRIISTVLCLMMIIPSAIIPVKAAGDSNLWQNYTESPVINGDIYEVSTPEQLAWILRESATSFFLDKTIKLMNDIDLGAHLWESINGSIGYNEDDKTQTEFSGNFDGNGFTIKNLDSNEGGLFGVVNVKYGNTISNVRFEDVSIRNSKTIGIVANTVTGNSTGTTIYDISVTGIVNASKKGIIGKIMSTSSLVLQNCVSEVYGMGIVSESDSSVKLDIYNCFYSSDKAVNISGTPNLIDVYRYQPLKTTPRGRNVSTIAFFNASNIAANMDNYEIIVKTDDVGEKILTLKEFGYITANEVGTANMSVSLTNRIYPGVTIDFNFPLTITKAEFTITFYAQNKVTKISTVGPITEGSFINAPTAPDVKGLEFIGWTSEFSDGEIVDLKTILVDTKVSAVYAVPKMSIAFNSNGGTEVPTVNNVVVNSTFESLNVIPPTKENYVFAGWYHDTGFTRKVAGTDKLIAAVTFFAKWNASEITVSFETNGGSTINPIAVPYDGVITNVPITQKEDSKFLGWFMDRALTVPFDGTAKITSNITLFASWKDYLRVTIYPNGGLLNGDLSQQPESINVVNIEPNSKFGTIIIPNFTRPGFVLDGWFYDMALTSKMAYEDTITTNKSIYAKWINAAVFVTYNTTGGYVIKSTELVYGKTLTPAVPQRTGYEFTGWYTDANYTTAFVATTPIIKDITLYAKWDKKSSSSKDNDRDDDDDEDDFVTVKYVASTGGVIEGIANQELDADDTTSSVKAVANTGYKFSKWNDGVTQAERTDKVKKDITYTAEFVATGTGSGTGTGTGTGSGTSTDGTTTTEPDWKDLPQTGLGDVLNSTYKPYDGLPSLSFSKDNNIASNAPKTNGAINPIINKNDNIGGNVVGSQITANSPMAPAVVSNAEMDSTESNGINVGLIAGILAFTGLIIGGVIFAIKKKKA